MHAGTHGKAGCNQRNFLTPWFKQSRTRSNNHQKKPLHSPSKREAFPPLRWFKFLFLNQFFLFFLSLCLNRGNPLLLTGQQSWLSGWCVTQLSKCLCEECVSREEVRGSPMWSRRFKGCRDFSSALSRCRWLLEECASTRSPRHSRDLRGARVLSPSVILHSSSSSPSLSPTQKHTLPASPFSLSLFFSPPFLAVLTDQITSPLFQVVERVFCVLPYSISINFCSSSVHNLYFWMTQRTT